MKALRTTLIVLFCLVGLWCGLMSARPPWIEPVPGVRLEPGRPVLSEAELRQDSAYALMRQACAAAPDANAAHEILDLVTTNAWSPAILSNALAFLDTAQPGLEMARRAARAPNPQVVSATSFSQTFSEFPGIRSLYRAFAVAAVTRAAQGDLAAAGRELEDLLRFADIASRGGTLIHTLVSASGVRMACDTLCRLAQRHTIPVATAERLRDALARLEAESEPWAETLRQERRFSQAATREVFANAGTADLFGVGPLPALRAAFWLAPLLGSTPTTVSNNLDACFGHFVALAERPYDAAAEQQLEARIAVGPHPLWTLLSHRDPVGRVLAGLLLPALGSARERIEERRVALRAAACAVALNRFRAERGRWPAALDELVPEFLPAVPDDLFARGPLRYRADESGGWVLYSIGANGVDDGGSSANRADHAFPPGS